MADVALITLTPSLVEVHVGEPVTLTATALNATSNGSPVKNVTICLFYAGKAEVEHFGGHGHRHHPDGNKQNLCTGVNGTDANGQYKVTFTSYTPGHVAIVAGALTGPAGSRVLSPISQPAHIMFWGHKEPRHEDRHRGWWR